MTDYIYVFEMEKERDGFPNPNAAKAYNTKNWTAKVLGKNAANHKLVFLKSKYYGLYFDPRSISKNDVLCFGMSSELFYAADRMYVRVLEINAKTIKLEKHLTMAKALKARRLALLEEKRQKEAAELAKKAKRAAAYQARKNAKLNTIETSPVSI